MRENNVIPKNINNKISNSIKIKIKTVIIAGNNIFWAHRYNKVLSQEIKGQTTENSLNSIGISSV
jgi:hypothetical protein